MRSWAGLLHGAVKSKIINSSSKEGFAWPSTVRWVPLVWEKRERSHSTFMKMALSLSRHVRLQSKNTPEVICLAYYNQYFPAASTYQAAPRWNGCSTQTRLWDQHKRSAGSQGSDVKGSAVKGHHEDQVRSVLAGQ